MDIPYFGLWIIAAVSLLLTAIITAGEAAIMRVTRASLQHALAAADAGVRPADKSRASRITSALKLVAEPGATITALIAVRTVACLVAGGALTIGLRVFWFQNWALLLAILLIGMGICAIAVWISPRKYGHRNPVKVMITLAPILTWMSALTPWSPDLSSDDADTDELVRDMVDRVDQSDAIEAEEKELIRSVIELRDTIVREVMVPRTEMFTVPGDAPVRKVLRLLLRSGYSRVPVTGDSSDDVVGVAYLKDVANLVDSDPLSAERPVRSAVRTANFVPESKPIDDLLREMQSSTSHIAIVFDEYGGVAGLVTIEDILEELVGELVDEHDSLPVNEPEEVTPGVWRVPSRLPVDELGDLFSVNLDDDEVDTVGGLFAKALGRVPLAGTSADTLGFHFVADRIEGRRKKLATVLVSKAAPVVVLPDEELT